MIDLHSHILSGIDDGAETMEMSLELATLYEQAGFECVIATPHWIIGTAWNPTPAILFHKINELNQLLKTKGVKITIYPGMEIALDNNIIDLLNQKKILTIAGQPYVLIETPNQRMPCNWETLFSNIKSEGYKIILAHPERCVQFHNNPAFINKINDAGIYTQVNYDSFLGYYGKTVQKAAFYLAENGYINCMATDSHDPVHRSPMNTANAIKTLKNRIGYENTEIISKINPHLVLQGLPLELPSAVSAIKSKKRRWFIS